MSLTQSVVEVAEYVRDKLEAHKATLGLEQVFYGDQNKIPVTPTACVEPSDKVREINGAPRRVQVDLEVVILVYLMRVDGTQVIRAEVDEVAEAIEAVLHEDPQLGNTEETRLAVHSLVTHMESGYAQRSTSLFRTARLTFSVLSQVQLPQGGV